MGEWNEGRWLFYHIGKWFHWLHPEVFKWAISKGENFHQSKGSNSLLDANSTRTTKVLWQQMSDILWRDIRLLPVISREVTPMTHNSSDLLLVMRWYLVMRIGEEVMCFHEIIFVSGSETSDYRYQCHMLWFYPVLC